MSQIKELAIIGGGIAGVSAAVYARRSGLDFIMFESKSIGGQALLMESVDNYVGLPLGSKGQDLAKLLSDTLTGLEIEAIPEEIEEIILKDSQVLLKTSKQEYLTKSLIIATGASFKKVGVKGEEEFAGKGVSYCAVCDGFFFRKKEVAVVGGGNTALEEACYLADIASKVTLIHRRDQFRALDYYQKGVFEKNNIEVVFDTVIEEIKGKDFLEHLVLKNVKTNEKSNLHLNGLFVAVGIKPCTDLLKDKVKTDEAGFIITDEGMQTSSPLIWACGDCRSRPLKQLITAASEGATASMGVYKYLKGHYISA
tara:strand:- start:598 stop:1530 length:933 start_codon:yes stop_codon:yes gene_type:complete